MDLKKNNRIYLLTLAFFNEKPIEYISNFSKIAIYFTCKDLRLCKLLLNIIEVLFEIERILIYYRY